MIRNMNVVKWIIYIAAVLIISVIQFNPSFPKIMQAVPLLLVPTVLSIAMFEGETAGAVFGVLAGLLWDAQGGRIFGFNALFLMIFGMFAGLLAEYLFRNSIVAALIFTAIVTAILEIITWFFFYNLFGSNDILFALLRLILPTCAYTVVFVFPIYYGAKMLNRKFLQAE